VFVSPVSVAAALSLAAAGATPGGTSEAELQKALGASHEQVAALGHTLLSAGKHSGVAVQMANAVYTKASILPEYVKVAQKVHGAEAAPFPETWDPVNKWVAKQTQGHITDLMQGRPDPLMVAALVNAVFFKGNWSSQFDPKNTAPGTFTTTDGTQLPARFMKKSGKMHVAQGVPELGNATVLRLDYGKGTPDFCALFVLPAHPGAESLAAAVNGLQALQLSTLPTAESKVDLALPKFKAEWGAGSLKPALQALGLATVFSGTGVFAALSSDPDVHIDDVLHKAVVEVTEEGTVAAAATAAVMKTRSIEFPLELSFDRPFVMVIAHAPTGMPLFIGRLERVEQSSFASLDPAK
jgi:serpin B